MKPGTVQDIIAFEASSSGGLDANFFNPDDFQDVARSSGRL